MVLQEEKGMEGVKFSSFSKYSEPMEIKEKMKAPKKA
jgi:hypothetical protein